MRAITVGWLLLLIAFAGCAEGFGAEVVARQTLGEDPKTSSGGANNKDGGADQSTTGAPGAKVPCTMGEMADCSCEQPGSMGTKYCMFDATSPTKGSFSACEDCQDPPMRGDSGSDPGDVSLIDSGVGPGSGGRGAGGSGGTPAATGGTTAPQPTARPPTGKTPCPTVCSQPCIPFGILACCRDNGTCGCTWAPGAYCS